MRQLGVKFEDVEDVEEVVVKTKSGRYVIQTNDVKIINAGGIKTLQVAISDMKYEEKVSVDEEDIKIVMEKANLSYEDAKELLIKNKGDLARTLLEIESKE